MHEMPPSVLGQSRPDFFQVIHIRNQRLDFVGVFVLSGAELCDFLHEADGGVSVDAEGCFDRPDIFSHGKDAAHQKGEDAQDADVDDRVQVQTSPPTKNPPSGGTPKGANRPVSLRCCSLNDMKPVACAPPSPPLHRRFTSGTFRVSQA
jgi:hypothetical protein